MGDAPPSLSEKEIIDIWRVLISQERDTPDAAQEAITKLLEHQSKVRDPIRWARHTAKNERCNMIRTVQRHAGVIETPDGPKWVKMSSLDAMIRKTTPEELASVTLILDQVCPSWRDGGLDNLSDYERWNIRRKAIKLLKFGEGVAC